MTSDFIRGRAEWDKFTYLFKRHEISAKTILLNEGEVSKRKTWLTDLEIKFPY